MGAHEEALRLTDPIRAKDRNALAALLASGADPNAQPQNGNAALHYNAILGSADLIPLLLGAGADPNLRNIHGETALHLTAYAEDDASYELLLRGGCDEATEDERGFTAAQIRDLMRAIAAMRAKDDAALRELLQKHPQFVSASFRILVPGRVHLEGTLLHLAAQEKLAGAAKLLLAAGADTEAIQNPGKDIACTALATAVGVGSKPIVQALLNAGAVVDPELGRPLHYAASENHAAMVALLLERGADPNRLDRYGQTPLCCAATFGKKSAKVLELLLQHGADPNLASAGKKRPVQVVAGNLYYEGVRVFHRHGSYETDTLPEKEIVGTLNWTLEQKNSERFRLLVAEPAVKATLAKHGKELLAKAIAKGQTDFVRILLAAGAPPSATVHEFGLTPLQLVKPDAVVSPILTQLWHAAATDDRDTVVRLLRQSPDLKDAIGSLWIEIGERQIGVIGTLVHLAVRLGDLVLLEWLLKSGADPNAHADQVDLMEKTPLELAVELGDTEMVEVLKARGATDRSGGRA